MCAVTKHPNVKFQTPKKLICTLVAKTEFFGFEKLDYPILLPKFLVAVITMLHSLLQLIKIYLNPIPLKIYLAYMKAAAAA